MKAKKTAVLLRTDIREDDGIALIMVLWMLTVLMVLVLTFSYMTRAETNSAFTFKRNAEKKFLAEAGIERGIMEIHYRLFNLSVPGSESWNADGTPYTVRTDDGYITVRITDESGKVDINRTPEVILRNLLANFGVSLENADVIVDSIEDWRDADDLHRLNGAESAYYMSLTTPYRARDADFESLEELILVKGMTAEILYGDDAKTGVIDLLTVTSPSGKININVAPKAVLMTIPGISSEIVEAILVRRESGDIRDPRELLGESYALMAPYTSTASSRTFSLESTGYKGTDTAGYTVRATVAIARDSSHHYLYYKNPAKATDVRDSNR